MFIKANYLRAIKYLQRQGLKSSIIRIGREVKNKLIYSRHVVYWRDLLHGEIAGYAMPEYLRVEVYEKRSDIPERLIKQITEYYSKELLEKYIRRRYENGALLWCLRTDNEDIGYTWSLAGRAMSPYYFPLLERDAYFFDVFVFPSHRGRGMNSILMNHLLRHYKSAGFYRAFIETMEWNAAEMKSLTKNGFVRLGLASKRFRRGKCKVTWWL